MNNTDIPRRFRDIYNWTRLGLMLIYFLVVFEIALLLVGLSMLFQFFYRLIQGEDAERLQSFTQDLNAFIYSALQTLRSTPMKSLFRFVTGLRLINPTARETTTNAFLSFTP